MGSEMCIRDRFYSGQEILKKREILNIKSPVQMVDFSHIEKYIFDSTKKNKSQISEENIGKNENKESKLANKENKSKNSFLENKNHKLVSKSTGEFIENEIPGKQIRK